jgi:hypothetical protein
MAYLAVNKEQEQQCPHIITELMVISIEVPAYLCKGLVTADWQGHLC